MTSSSASGLSPETRNYSLDTLRGIAILGLLIVSIWQFGGFTTNQQNFYTGGWHGGNFKLMAIVSILFEGKMAALFAMVFGAGILLFLQKKEHPVPISNADAYIRSQLWLMGFGLINAFILLWPGDILFNFGVLGILLFGFSRMSAKGLIIAAIVCTLIYCGKNYWYYSDDKKDYKKWKAISLVEKKFSKDSLDRARKDSADRKKDTVLMKDILVKNKIADSIARKNDTLTRRQKEDKNKWEGRLKDIKYDSAKTKGENKSMHAGWGKVWNHLVGRSQYQESFWLYKNGVWEIGALMFLGMALLSMGFFSSRFSSSRYFLLGLISFLAGLALAWWRIKQNDARVQDYAVFLDKRAFPYNLLFPLERTLMAVGYASIVMGLLRKNMLGWIGKAFAAAGRMALSNYFLQTLICTFFFYGYGFSFFGRMAQWELYFFVAEVTLAQIVFSVLWLKYYYMGPMEWLWRCLVYRKWLPNKKPSTHQ